MIPRIFMAATEVALIAAAPLRAQDAPPRDATEPGKPTPSVAPALSAQPRVLPPDASVRKPPVEPFLFTPLSPRERPSGGVGLGASGGIAEGKRLEASLWAGGGAVIGSLGGPLGAMIGAGAGAVAGLFVAVFIVPHNGPEERR